MIEIEPYSDAELCQILHQANRTRTPLELIDDDIKHVIFLKEYLGPKGLNAKFYIKESNYISVDYLTDYSLYYSKNFVDYGNKCERLHFFNFDSSDQKEFATTFWDAVLDHNNEHNQTPSFWAKYYLGFIVVRPIPNFMVGYTILRHYNYRQDAVSFDEKRNYWGIKNYDVHVFGTRVRIESLAFLSQDSNVAACATIAIWCMLQRAVENYYINLKSPYEITMDAGLTKHDGSRIFPNNGLNPEAICSAITKNNLHTEIRNFKDLANRNERVRTIVHAYSRIRLPLILGLNVKFNGGFGKHATAICGHRTADYQPPQTAKTGITGLFTRNKKVKDLELRASSIEELYMHDDQWGPFSRLRLVGERVSSSWNEHTKENELGEVTMLVIPVFKKVRIPVEDIERLAEGLNRFVYIELADLLTNAVSWDIQLFFSTDFKNEIRTAGGLNPKNKTDRELMQKLLEESMPKYIWVSTLYTGDVPLIHFVYDATGLRHTPSLLFAFSYIPELTQKLIARLEELRILSLTDDKLKKLLELWFHDSVSGFIKSFSWFNPLANSAV